MPGIAAIRQITGGLSSRGIGDFYSHNPVAEFRNEHGYEL